MTHFLPKIRIPWYFREFLCVFIVRADGVGNDSALLVSYSGQFNKPFLRACQVPWLWAKDRLGFEFQFYHFDLTLLSSILSLWCENKH